MLTQIDLINLYGKNMVILSYQYQSFEPKLTFVSYSRAVGERTGVVGH
jgi:hypothetical protein